MMLLGFAGLGYVGYRKVRHAAVAGALPLRARLSSSALGRPAADRISELIDIVLLKAEARLIIAGMTGSPFASLRGRTTTPQRGRSGAVCNQNGQPAIGEKFLFQSAITL